MLKVRLLIIKDTGDSCLSRQLRQSSNGEAKCDQAAYTTKATNATQSNQRHQCNQSNQRLLEVQYRPGDINNHHAVGLVYINSLKTAFAGIFSATNYRINGNDNNTIEEEYLMVVSQFEPRTSSSMASRRIVCHWTSSVGLYPSWGLDG